MSLKLSAKRLRKLEKKRKKEAERIAKEGCPLIFESRRKSVVIFEAEPSGLLQMSDFPNEEAYMLWLWTEAEGY